MYYVRRIDPNWEGIWTYAFLFQTQIIIAYAGSFGFMITVEMILRLTSIGEHIAA